MQKKMMRQHRRMNSMGSMPMGFTGAPGAMAQLQMAAQQQQMALQMSPMGGPMGPQMGGHMGGHMGGQMGGQIMMSPQHSRSSSASSFSLNGPLRQVRTRRCLHLNACAGPAVHPAGSWSARSVLVCSGRIAGATQEHARVRAGRRSRGCPVGLQLGAW